MAGKAAYHVAMVLRVAVGCGALLLAAGLAWHVRGLERVLGRPVSLVGARYVGSGSCRKCHGDHYASWHRTFHRTMTQEANPSTVLGDFSGRELHYMGVSARMERGREGEYRVRISDGATSFTAQVVRTVGSHRYQQYLAREDDLFIRLPVAWDVEAGRFIHMNGAFLTADPLRPEPSAPIASADYNRHVVRWNDNCIFCHNVAPNPGADGQGRFASTVAELGVACEACHGPGGRHARDNRDPLRRYLQHLGMGKTPDIAAPERIGAARSSEVCGRCHGQRISADIDDVHRHGDRFVPGELLSKYSTPLARDTTLGGEEGVFAARFWSDGTPRLTAYEYQGFLQSACAKDADFSCGSCHSMHGGDPRGQLRPDLLSSAHVGAAEASSDGLCTQCHEAYRGAERAAVHSGHPAESLGARCVSCHMPKVVYGLVGTHRSHRITVPSGGAPGATPDACALCHVDANGSRLRDERLRMFDLKSVASVEETLTTEALVLAGDPVERSVAAAALGSEGAAASGADRARALALLLNVLAEDSYPAVRDIARRSLLALLTRFATESGNEHGMQRLRDLRATDAVEQRSAVVRDIRAGLPSRLRFDLDAAWVADLRGRAQSVAIAIGE